MNAAPRPLGRLDRGDAIVLPTVAPPAPLARLGWVVLGSYIAGACIAVLLAIGGFP